jgi:hypothetical protein
MDSVQVAPSLLEVPASLKARRDYLLVKHFEELGLVCSIQLLEGDLWPILTVNCVPLLTEESCLGLKKGSQGGHILVDTS